VHVLRTLDQSLALHADLSVAARVVVIGAGFIGAEAASTAHALGCDVTVVEALPVPLERGLGPEMGAAVAGVHADNGVRLLTGTGVAGIEGEDEVTGVRLADGTLLPAEVVVVGIGVVPCTEWLEGSGLTLRDGVVCDATLAAGPPGVVAAGDVVRWPHPLFDDEEMRIEHWTNAFEHGGVAAKNLLLSAMGEPPVAYDGVPFFWSDQYGHRIQFLGRSSGAEEVQVVRGSPDDRKFVALYRRGARLWGALGLDEPKQLMGYRKLLVGRATWDEALEHAKATA
jgi:NADPH-dependent 2,4-dienoyl-CoA reductase/sulfur reductase-like enzyme